MDLAIIIPCYNEAGNVPKIRDEFFPVVAKLAQTQSVEVIFVDDGSSDGTYRALLEAFGHADYLPGVTIKFEQHPVNRGLGAALRTGFMASQGEIIVTTDCDGTYRFSEIPGLLSHLTPEVDIVTASPYHPQGGVAGVPAYRLILSQGSSAIYRILSNRHIHTYTALFRAYRRQIIQVVPFESNGFLAGTELMVNAIRMGFRVAEYPTTLHSRVIGQSKARLAKTIKAHLKFQQDILVPWHPYGTVIKGSGEAAYLYTNGQKQLFPSAEIFLSHGYCWEQMVQVLDEYLYSLTDGPLITFRDGSLVKGSGDTVFVIEHGKKREIYSAAIFEGLGYRWNNIRKIPDSTLQRIELGPTVCSTDRHPDGTLVKGKEDPIYLLRAGQKCHLSSPQVFLSWGYKWNQVITISESELAGYPLGPAVVAQEKFCDDVKPYVVSAGLETNKLLPRLLPVRLP